MGLQVLLERGCFRLGAEGDGGLDPPRAVPGGVRDLPSLAAGVSTSEYRYLNALYHLLASQTSCCRYWGTGRWTEYGKEICRRTMDILKHDF